MKYEPSDQHSNQIFEFEAKPEKLLMLFIMRATLEKANIKMDQTCITLWI